MSRELTPREKAIIRETKRQGEELYSEKPQKGSSRSRVIISTITFAAIFICLALFAYYLLTMVTPSE